ncbi:MAG: serine/threonine protein kinase [Phycisphaerales bacterium]|nr:MAG: serine/threonine protein kinase [Phycisphaerales bacterium]
MTPEQKKRIRELFLAACQENPGTRGEFLARACPDDDLVRKEVESLLENDDEAGTFLGSPALGKTFAAANPESLLAKESALNAGASAVYSSGQSPPADPRCERIGQYKLLDTLGRGGMGVVYRAQQENPRRTVALKVIKPGIESREMLKRFHHEGQVLGCLQHPGIAQVFEAGTEDTPQGPQPFFAMELVHGQPLTEYAKQHSLDTRKRLELVAKICDAVHHAHQKGIVHRDLKPGNILVDDSGQPKILDFGVARATDADIRTTTLQTDVGQLIGTIAYMSPEQVAGDSRELDTRSDVYSLGVVCYELLTGRQPHDITQKTIPQAARIIAEENPTALTAVDKGFRGDVETIVSKALEKDKHRRYQSASDLAADIRRFLADEPISARPATTMYQLRKFARRNKALVGGTLATFLALLAGVIGISFQAVRLARERDNAKRAEHVAQQQRDEAEAQRAEAQRQTAMAKAVDNFLNKDLLAAANPMEMGRDVTVREVLDKAAATVDDRFSDQPLVEAAVHKTLGTTYVSLGEYSLAESQVIKALEHHRMELGEDHPETLDSFRDLSSTYRLQGRLAEAETQSLQTLEKHRRVFGEDAAETVGAWSDLAASYLAQARYEEGEEILLRVLKARRRLLGEEHPHTFATTNVLADLYTELGRFADAERLYSQLMEHSERVLGREHPSTSAIIHDLGKLHLDQGHYREAESLLANALEIRRQVFGEEHPRTLITANVLAQTYRRQGRFTDAEQLYVQISQARSRTLGEEHPHTLHTMNSLANVYARQGKHAEAEELYVTVVDARTHVLGQDHVHTLNSMGNLAALYSLQKRYSEAEPVLIKVLEVQRRLRGDEHPQTLVSSHNLAKLYEDLGRLDEAEGLYLKTLSARERALGEQHPHTLVTQHNLGRLYDRQGRFDEAELMHGEALEVRREVLGNDNRNTLASMYELGATLLSLKRFAEAEALALEFEKGIRNIFGPTHYYMESAFDLLTELYETWGKPDKAEEYRALRAALPSDEETQ